MLSELVGGGWTGLRMVVLPPLGVAVLLGLGLVFARRALSTRAVAGLAVAGLGSAFLASVLAFAELVSNEETSALVDRMGTWAGAGVGSRALIGELALRLDALSSVFCLVISGLGLLLFVNAGRSLASAAPSVSGYQRFFCFASFQVGMSLVFVLASDMLLMLIAFAGVGLGTYLLAGLRGADPARSRMRGRLMVAGRIGDAGLLVAALLLFRALSGAGARGLSLEGVRAALLELGGFAFAWPAWTGLGEIALVEALGGCLVVAVAAMAAQLGLFAGLTRETEGPLPGSALVQTATGFLVVTYLVVRFSFIFVVAPVSAASVAALGAGAALVGAGFACRAHEITRVLAWSSFSQLGLVLVAAGVGAQTAAVFHAVSHAFFKGLLLMAAGVIVLAVKGERDMRRMGSLGSRLSSTRISVLIGAFSLAGGLPLTAGFFSIQQIAVAARGGDPGAGSVILYPVVLFTLGLTAFYTFRLVFLALYGKTHLPSNVQRDEVEDPAPVILWLMGILATLSITGAVIGFPQFWADFFFGGEIEQSNSLRYFLSGVVSNLSEMPLDPSRSWGVAGWTLAMTLLGLGAGIVGYAVRPAPVLAFASWSRGWASRLPRPSARFGRAPARATEFLGSLAARLARIPNPGASASSLSAGLLRSPAERLLKRLQSGFVQHSLALSITGSLGLLAYLLWQGGA